VNIGKAFGDMKDMMQAAPGMIRSANEIAAAAQAQAAQYQAQPGMAPTPDAAPQPGNLEPIAGVTLEIYALISKDMASVGYDQARGAEVAARHGVSSADWGLAQKGWGDRIRADRGVGIAFNKLYTA